MVDILAALAFFLPLQAYLVMGLHSIYKSVEEEKAQVERETRGQLERSIQVIVIQARNIFSQKYLNYTVASVTILALAAWALNVIVYAGVIIQVWAFSLALAEALVLFFTIETIYQLAFDRLSPTLPKRVPVGRLVKWTAFAGSLLIAVGSTAGCMFNDPLSCTVNGYMGDLAYYLFFLILFITGLGAIGIVNTVSDSLAARFPSEKRAGIIFFTALAASLTLLFIILAELPQLGPTGLYGQIGLELAFFAGLGYTLYLYIRRRAIYPSTLVYAVLMLALSGLFLGYNLNVQNPPSLTSSSQTLSSTATSLATSLTLFTLGYLTILFQLPRKFERKLKMRDGRLAPYLTFLLAFTALASFQLAYFSYGPSIFLYEKETPLFLGLVVGGVIFTSQKAWRSHRRKILNPSLIVPFCDKCWSRLETKTNYCEKCGLPVSTRPEKILFIGEGQQIETKNHHHSRLRKAGTLIAGGPVGYLAFGRGLNRTLGAEKQLAITDAAVYFAGEFYPLGRISSAKTGNFSDRLILRLKMNHEIHDPSELQKTGNEMIVEWKTRDARQILKEVQGLIGEQHQSSDTASTLTRHEELTKRPV